MKMVYTLHHYLYFIVLLLGLLGLGVIAHYLQLIPLAVFSTLLWSTAFFLVWDCSGIALHIFATNKYWVSGVFLGSQNLPLEELFFLILLGINALVLEQYLARHD
jgi:lycopene cyclase domain-containing protein